ncbi:hypothetical protein HK101_010939 [Irineochytrium annulatum]|nr:hypothetical protein HK101_010939 [Irineochytrium annulatum]
MPAFYREVRERHIAQLNNPVVPKHLRHALASRKILNAKRHVRPRSTVATNNASAAAASAVNAATSLLGSATSSVNDAGTVVGSTVNDAGTVVGSAVNSAGSAIVAVGTKTGAAADAAGEVLVAEAGEVVEAYDDNGVMYANHYGAVYMSAGKGRAGGRLDVVVAMVAIASLFVM